MISLRLLDSLEEAGREPARSELCRRLGDQIATWRAATPANVPLRQIEASLAIHRAKWMLSQQGRGAEAVRHLDLAESLLEAILEQGAGGAPEQHGLQFIAKLRAQAMAQSADPAEHPDAPPPGDH